MKEYALQITACWIVKNEEKNIASSLESVKAIADELIVVDTGSLDKTMDIAADLGAQVHHFQWTGDFSAARNYALSLAKGDVLIFLDADEYFEPKLEAFHKQKIAAAFQDPEIEGLKTDRLDIDQNTGKILAQGSNLRIFRNHRGCFFQNSIHEIILNGQGRPLITAELADCRIIHTGYSPEIYVAKMKRNIGLLAEALTKASDSYERFRLHCYLMREHKTIGEHGKAFQYLLEILPHREFLERLCGDYGKLFIEQLHHMINLAAAYRHKASRLYLQKTLFALIPKHYREFNGTAAIDLYYQLLFDYRADRFLMNFDEIMTENSNKNYAPGQQLNTYDLLLYQQAALEMWLRGQKTKALDYAVKGLSNKDYFKQSTFAVLLNCLKGLPPENILAFLNKIFDPQDQALRTLIKEGLIHEGYNPLFLYYQKKLMDAGLATKGDYIYLLVVAGKYDQARQYALELMAEPPGETGRSSSNHSAAGMGLLLCCLCSGQADFGFGQDQLELWGEYGKYAEAFYRHRPLPLLTEEDLSVLERLYPLIAFAGGLAAADKFRSLFQQDQRACFMVKAAHCLTNELYGELLNESIPAGCSQDLAVQLCQAQCCLALREQERAFAILEALVLAHQFNDQLFNLLFLLAEQSPPPLGQKALAIYNNYRQIYDEITDLQDMINTGLPLSGQSASQMRTFKKMKLGQLDQLIKEEKNQPAVPALMELWEKAIPLYEEQQLLCPAIQAAIRLLAHSCRQEVTLEKLGFLFAAIGNKDLAGKLRLRALSKEEKELGNENIRLLDC